MIRCWYETKKNGRTVRVPVAPTVAASVPQEGMMVDFGERSYRVAELESHYYKTGDSHDVVVEYMDCGITRYIYIPLWKWRESILAQHMRGWGA